MVRLIDSLKNANLEFVGELVKRYEEKYDYVLWCSDSKYFYNKIVLEDNQIINNSLELYTLKDLILKIKDRYESTLENTSLFLGYELELKSELAIINAIIKNLGIVENLLA